MRQLLLISNGEGANLSYGFCQKEKGRIGRQAYSPVQEEGNQRWTPSGASRSPTL